MEHIIVEVLKYDVYENGEINTGIKRTEKFHFDDEYDALKFMRDVRKAVGFIDLTRRNV